MVVLSPAPNFLTLYLQYSTACRQFPNSSVLFISVFPERIERGGPCWLLKLRWMRTHRVQMKGGPSSVGSLGLSCRYNRFLFCLGCSSRQSTKYFFFLTVHYFNSFVVARQAGQAAMLGRLPLSKCLCVFLVYKLPTDPDLVGPIESRRDLWWGREEREDEKEER